MGHTVDMNTEAAYVVASFVESGDVAGIRIIGQTTYSIVRTYELSGWFVHAEIDYGHVIIFRFESESDMMEYLDGIYDDSPA